MRANDVREWAASVSQVTGLNVYKVTKMISGGAVTSRRNRKDCEHLERQLRQLEDLRRQLQGGSGAEPGYIRDVLVERLEETLQDARALVESCKKSNHLGGFVKSERQAKEIERVNKRMDEVYAQLLPVINQIDASQRLERIWDDRDDRRSQDSDEPLPGSTSFSDTQFSSNGNEPFCSRAVFEMAQATDLDPPSRDCTEDPSPIWDDERGMEINEEHYWILTALDHPRRR